MEQTKSKVKSKVKEMVELTEKERRVIGEIADIWRVKIVFEGGNRVKRGRRMVNRLRKFTSNKSIRVSYATLDRGYMWIWNRDLFRFTSWQDLEDGIVRYKLGYNTITVDGGEYE